MDIGIRIKELRKDKNWSQEELCQQAGLKREYLSRVENGHTIPALATLEKIAAALHVSLSYLVDISDDDTYETGYEPAPQVSQPQAPYQIMPQELCREIEEATEEMCIAFKQRIKAILKKSG